MVIPRMNLFTAVLSFLLSCTLAEKDSFDEELILRRLPSQHMAAVFRFAISTPAPLTSHYDLFPRVIGDMLLEYGLDEFHISLTQGNWRTHVWGFAPQPAAPAGAQIHAWFANTSATDNGDRLDEEWKNLVNTLSGFFCASLSQVYPILTTSTEHSFQPTGLILENEKPNSSRMRYASLPSENVCTENLTPWKKLLPCKDQGLAQLLSPIQLFAAHYHSLSVYARKVCRDGTLDVCADIDWELSLSLVVVFDLPLPSKSLDWSLRSLFDRAIYNKCSLATSSAILVDITSSEAVFAPEPTSIIHDLRSERKYAHFDVNNLVQDDDDSNPLMVSARYSQKLALLDIEPPLFSLHSFIAGTGQFRGTLVSQIINGDSKSKKAVFFHMVPWILRVFLHSMSFTCNGTPQKLLFIAYTPGKDRLTPHTFELGMDLPSQSKCYLKIDFQKSFLRWTEYPPDAHRGFFVPAPALIFLDDNLANQTVLHGNERLLRKSISASSGRTDKYKALVTLFGEILLVQLPTPDFSMPYNVICLVCTVVALCFGPVHNLTTKSLKLISEKEAQKRELKNKVKRLLITMKEKVMKLCGRTVDAATVD